jgi:c(7)-type cytochrome triheme protein
MRHIVVFVAVFTSLGLATGMAQDKKAPEKISFPSKQGPVTFLHARHIDRESGDCTSCHDKLWQQTSEPLKNSQGCHTCHKPDGKAFSARDRSNCVRCHPPDVSATSKQP